MSKVTIWHNPRCSKSRAALKLLEEAGVSPTVRHYLTDPPDRAALQGALAALGLKPAQIVRHREKEFSELGLRLTDSADELIDAMLAHPKLIERPIVFANERAAVGRPPEAVLDIL